MINPKLVRERIRDVRKQQNYTIAQFAEKLNMSVSAYTKLESGQTALTIERMNEIASFLALDSELLLGLPETSPQEPVTLGQFNEQMRKIETMLSVIVKEVHLLKNRVGKLEAEIKETKVATLN
jgi:transcriptional regulator with XRE-family HTH domain